MILLGNGKSSWYQWDTNQTIIITDISIDQIESQEVHFSSDVDADTTALVTKPYVENGIVYAPVPNILLTTSGTVHIYVYVSDGIEAHTEVHKAVKVVFREKPSDYVYTETEVKNYETLVERISALEIVDAQTRDEVGKRISVEPQTLTDEQKAQARENIGAGSVSTINGNAPDENGNVTIIDVTAAGGQTVIVKSVDENGKPTGWEAADYQPKTHWSETVYGEVLPLTKFVANGTKNTQLPTTVLELGKTYTVVYDGTPYTCEAKAVENGGVIGVGIGNDVIFGGEQTSEPFGIAYAPYYNYTGVIAFDSDVHSVQITGEKTVYHKIPREYLYSKRIEFTLGGEDTPGYWYAHTTADVRDIINDAENGVFQYATITFPMDVDERTADMHLTMPLASHETFTRDDGITVYKAWFECETELDKRYVFVIAIEAWPEVGVIISGLTKKIADSGSVDTAEVGQTIVVKSVDENGKPTEWAAVDKANEVNHGRLLAEVKFTEETTGVTITDINADVIELAVLIEAATSTPPKFTINEHTVNILGGGWAGGSHIFVKIDKGNGVARIKATATNKGRSTFEIPWGEHEIVESIGIGNLGFASGDFVRVYEGLLAPQLKENWVWND